MHAFNYHRPKTLDEAAALLTGADDGKVMAGGMTLIPTLKQRLAAPSDIIDLASIPGLVGVTQEGGGLRIGAMTRHMDVAGDPLVNSLLPGLAKLAGGIGDPQVRARGTIGGSISNADPAADYPAGLVALGATVRTTQREIPAEEFFTGFFETALEPGELVTSVLFPAPQASAYAKFRHPASGYAVVGSFVVKTDAGVRVAITGAGGSVFRWPEAEEALAANFDRAALADLAVDPGELNGDMHASSEYRANLVKVMTQRAVDALKAG